MSNFPHFIETHFFSINPRLRIDIYTAATHHVALFDRNDGAIQ